MHVHLIELNNFNVRTFYLTELNNNIANILLTL